MTNESNGNLCTKCKFRFRRLFIAPPGEYEPEDGIIDEEFESDNDNIIISNTCLISGLDITREITIDCSHFMRNDIEHNEKVPFFKSF